MTKKPITKRLRKVADEYLMLIGGPSNTFNGYFHEDAAGTSVPEPAPADASDAEIREYIRGTGGFTGDHPQRTVTHDVYWANFVYSAVKLVELGVVRPQHGDILTFMIYVPPFLRRQEMDWDASPYNDARRNSSWVAQNRPYDRSLRAADQGALAPLPKPEYPRQPRLQPAPPSRSEPEINHEILMRTTEETQPDGGFHKRAHDRFAYEQAIAGIPRRLVFGSGGDIPAPLTSTVPPLVGVQVKLLLMTDVEQLYDYLRTGEWPRGDRLISIFDIPDEQHMGDLRPMSECTWGSMESRRSGVRYRNWEGVPSVNRSRVKIKRLDYFGHAGYGRTTDEDAFYLEYGWANKKGEETKGEVRISDPELEAHLSRRLFAKDSYGKLWGCNLGDKMGPMLAKYLDKVVGCHGWTTFEHILDGNSLPEPAYPDEPFVTFP